jgi:hypothetical protein
MNEAQEYEEKGTSPSYAQTFLLGSMMSHF